MSTYVDTSAVIAIMDADDSRHDQAAQTWTQLVESDEEMVISSYAVVETAALLQSRYDTKVVKLFFERMLPLFRIVWMDASLHSSAETTFLDGVSKSGPSLVDFSAFEVIRREQINDVFAYDRHFEDRRFNLFG